MGKAWLCALALMVAISPARADWKITSVSTDMAGRKSVVTEYYKDKLLRTDSEGIPGHPLVSVEDVAGLKFTQWLPLEKEYATHSASTESNRVPVPTPDSAPPEMYLIESSTTDTGERETMFGRTARHLVTHEKRSLEESPGAESKLQAETVTDGWYVEAAGLPRSRFAGTTYLLAFNGRHRPVVKATHTGERLSGLVVREKVTFVNAKDQTRKLETTMEVTDLYEGVLPQNLFEPPSGFKRVERLPDGFFVQQSFTEEIESYWNLLQSWFFSWFL